MSKTQPFDEYANEYDEWYERDRFAYESELAAIKSLMPETGNKIEVGAGTGRFAAPLKVDIAVEPSAKMRKIAEKRGVDIIEGAAERLMFVENWFDIVLMVTSIEFFDDIESALNEARRVLKRNGSIIIGFIDKESLIGREYEEKRGESRFFKDARLFTVPEVISFLENAGFKDFEFRQTIFRALEDIKEVEPVKEGYGEGSFVVVKGKK